MRILRKAGSYGAVLLLCFLLTGFFGGEKPTEAVTAVITALENNDAAAFGQRVTPDYWLSAFTALDKSGMKDMSEAARNAFAELLSASKGFMGAVELTKRSGNSMQGFARVIYEGAGKSVGEGNFANLCRRMSLSAFPFDPEVLKKAQVSEAGSGAAQNTATITCTMPDGQQGALGMVQIDGKWRIVSFGGNKKAAETQAVATLDALQKKATRLKERAPRAEAYKAQALDRHEKLGRIKEKKDREAATAYLAKTLPCKEAPRIALNGPLTLDSPELWDAVRQSMAQCLQNPEEPPSAEKWLENAHTLGPFTKYPVSEWLSETGNIALVRSPSYDNDYFPSDFAKYKDKDDDFFRQRWEKWIAGDYEEVQDYTSYVFQEKRAGVWSPTGVRSSTSIDLKNNQTTHSYYGIAKSAKLPFSAEEFMTALAPRFPKLLAEARALAEKAQQAEKARAANALATMKNDVAAPLAQGLEKRDPAVLDRLYPYGVLASLAPGDTPITIADLTKKVDALAAPMRALALAVQTGKPLPGLEDLWNVAALRAADFELVQNAPGDIATALATLKTAGGLRYLTFIKGEKYWLLASAPQADKTAATLKARELIQLHKNSPEIFAPTQAQKELRALADLLRHKKGDAFLKHIDLLSVLSWDPNGSMMARDDHDIAKVLLYPSLLDPFRAEIRNAVNSTGACQLTGVTLTADILESANFTLHKKNIVQVHTKPHPIFFLLGEGTSPLLIYANETVLYMRGADRLKDDYDSTLERRTTAKKDESTLKRLCAEVFLDEITCKDANYTIKQKGTSFYIEAQVDLVNTLNIPVLLSRYELITWDAYKRILTIENSHIKNIELLPNRPTRITVEKSLSEAELHALYAVHAQKKGGFRIRPHTVIVNGAPLTADYGADKLTLEKLPDGAFSLSKSPALRLKTPVYRGLFQTESERLSKESAAFKQAQKDAALKLNKEILGKISATHNAATHTTTVYNGHSVAVTSYSLRYDISEKDVVIQSKDKYFHSTIKSGQSVNVNMNIPLAPGQKLDVRVDAYTCGNVSVSPQTLPLALGIVPPLLYQNSPELFSMTGAQAHDLGSPGAEAASTASVPAAPVAAPAASSAMPATETPKPETPKPETPKAEMPAPSVPSAPAATPVAPAGKTPGKAVAATGTQDLVGLTAFAPDGKPDSVLRVMAHHASPLVAVRIDNVGGVMASWKTKDVKTAAQGVLAVLKDGKPCNPGDASFALDVSSPTALDLLVQDTGAIAGNKTRLRVVFFHKDGSRSYAFMEAAAQ